MKQGHLIFKTHSLNDYVIKKYGKAITKNLPYEKINKVNLPTKKLIDNDVIEVLKTYSVEDNILFLNAGILDRKLYVNTNKVLESLDGQWNKNKKGHVFDFDPSELIDQVIFSKYYDKESDFGYYPTPKEIVSILITQANLKPGLSILEPSAGQGHILDELKNDSVICGELMQKNIDVLEQKNYHVSFTNFLNYKEKHFDRIIMNPPFAKQQDLDHVTHAYSLLNPGGRLVSIMSNGITFRSNHKTKSLRDLINLKGCIENLPNNSFQSSGTNVHTVMVVLNK